MKSSRPKPPHHESGKRLAVLVDSRAAWDSRRAIAPSLKAAYAARFPSVSMLTFGRGASLRAVKTLARKLKWLRPHTIVFTSDLPHPLPLLKELQRCWPASGSPRYLFHVYGSFTLLAHDWLKAEPFLRGRPCAFLCGSPRHRALVAGLNNQRNTVISGPWPVDAAIYRYQAGLRKETRAKLELGDTARLLLYAGRLSTQKNILLLLKEATRELKRHPNLHLALAGRVDEVGAPFFDPAPRRSFAAAFHRALAEASRATGGRIRYLGHQSPSELAALYCAADRFVSVGLHHDENFGLAPAEAMMCGLPVILTDWGGSAQFLSRSQDGTAIPVTLTSRGLRVDCRKLRKALSAVAKAPHSDRKRIQRSRRVQAKYSVESVARNLAKVVKQARFQPFEGFSPTLRELFLASLDGVPYPRGPSSGGLYKKIYASFLRA